MLGDKTTKKVIWYHRQPTMLKHSGALRGSKKSVFIVDDHPLVCSALERLLDAQPDLTACGTTDNVDDALRQIAVSRPTLVIVDISLKGANGLELIKRIHEDATARGDAPPLILVVSAHDELLYATRALKAGANGYLNKDVDLEQILRAVRSVLGGQIFISDTMRQRQPVQASSKGSAPRLATVADLSDRELEVFELIGRGLATSVIACQLELSIKTIETHQANIKRKLNLESHLEVVRESMLWVMEQQ